MQMGIRVASALAGCVVGLGLVTFVGCGGSGPQGKLHGSVTYQGAPVPAGSSISFISENGSAAVAKVDASGKYSMNVGTPPGQYTAVVMPPAKEMSPEEAMKAAMAKKGKEKVREIPQRYRLPATSPAKVEIKEGDAEYNLDMTDK